MVEPQPPAGSPSPGTGPVRVAWQDRVAVVTIDRPERRNAVDLAALHALRRAQEAAVREGARALVLTGAPPAFCAGADLTGAESGEFTAALVEVLAGFGALAIPTVAAVDGAALGAGTQLAMACDLRVATERATFGIPAARLGLAVDHFTIECLVRELGWPTARAMLLAAQTYAADRLHAIGAIHRIGSLDDALAWATELSGLAPLTIATHKLALGRSAPPPAPDEVLEAARMDTWASADAQEGRVAFLEKRAPVFRGR